MDHRAFKGSRTSPPADRKPGKSSWRDLDVMTFRRQAQDAEAAKLVRLRTLRLAKEAADKEAADREALVQAEAAAAGKAATRRAKRAKA
jgi:hypothetical protein